MNEVQGPYELPNSWAWTSIEDVCDLINGRAFKPSEWSSEGLPIIRIQNLNNPDAEFNYCNFEVDEKYLVNNGKLLFAWSGTPGTSFGAHIWKGERAYLNQHIFKIELDEDHLNKLYFMYLINRNVFEYIQKAHGTAGLAHITKKKFETSLIPLPPLPEQHRIVAKIEELFNQLDAGVSALEKSRAQLKRYRQSVLKAAVEGKLTEEWRRDHPDMEPASALLEQILKERRVKWENDLRTQNKEPRSYRYKDPVLPIPSDFPKLQNTWTWASYDSLTTFVTSGSRAWKKYLGKGSGIFILLQNLKDRQLDLDLPTFVDAPLGAEAERTRVKDGDILISIVGKTGTTCLVRGIKEAYVSQSVALTRPSHLINGRYLEYYFSSEEWGQRFFNDKAYGMGRGHLLLSHIKETPVVLPPLAEQHQIVSEIESRLSVADQTEATLEANLRRAARLRQSILKKAFRGELVPQDPNDEPASVLLERIRMERSQIRPATNRGQVTKGRVRPRKNAAVQMELI